MLLGRRKSAVFGKHPWHSCSFRIRRHGIVSRAAPRVPVDKAHAPMRTLYTVGGAFQTPSAFMTRFA